MQESKDFELLKKMLKFWKTSSLSTLNEMQETLNIKTLDVSMLYTKSPLEGLKEKLKEIVDEAFIGGHNKYILKTSMTARWFHGKCNDPRLLGNLVVSNGISLG